MTGADSAAADDALAGGLPVEMAEERRDGRALAERAK
jgi:hypothetical protein